MEFVGKACLVWAVSTYSRPSDTWGTAVLPRNPRLPLAKVLKYQSEGRHLPATMVPNMEVHYRYFQLLPKTL
jgi:hypothetical protein